MWEQKVPDPEDLKPRARVRGVEEEVVWDFPGCPVVKNPPSSAGDPDSIPGQGTKIPHAAGQRSLRTTANELVRLNERVHVPQKLQSPRSRALKPVRLGARTPQREARASITKTQHSQKKKKKKENK